MKSTPPLKKREGKLIKSENLFPVVGIGASAGGLDAFKKLLKAIPEDSGMAYVLVQHLDPKHESMLPELLQKVTSIPVLEITDDITVQRDHIYVIPSNKMMVAKDGVLRLAPRPVRIKTERYLPIDLFFISLADVHQTHAIGVVLSGTASDGTMGLKAIKDHGGITFAQDEASAAYEGMPNSAVQAGVVDFILPPDKIPGKLLEVTKIISPSGVSELNPPLGEDEVFKQIISLLRIRKATDFTYYKQTTIHRRILRRMAINKNEEPVDYLKYLRENKLEQDILFQDLLIPVTAFFRDIKTFNHLCEKVFPLIKKSKTSGEPIRVWVAGCSTGEEAYSIAICFKEFLNNHFRPKTSSKFQMTGSEDRLQIFATDLSEPAIAKARLGIYKKIELSGISSKRLEEFFTKTNGSYQVNRQIRDMCIFAHHNFLKDPPFGKIDLISCRNVLIYMEPYLQKKALSTFHYALNPKGLLLLGKSETSAGVPQLFTSAAKNEKLYTRKDVPGRFMHVVTPRAEHNLSLSNDKPKIDSMRSDFQKTADDIMLSKFAPAGVVVNETLDIVQYRGTTSNYLEQTSGKPSHNLLVLAKQGLAFELRSILHKAKKEKNQVLKEHIPVEINGQLCNISIEAIPLPNMLEPHYLVVFHDNNSTLSTATKGTKTNNAKSSAKFKGNEKDLRLRQLEQELAQTREDMRSITEDQEAANEELQSANEELLSGSEELQSLNEELETSKEELQSTNEELTIINQEMIGLNEQIVAARIYAESIVANIREPLLVLDKHLRIKSANQAFYTTFRVKEQETEGTLIYDLRNKQWNLPELRTLLENILPDKSIITDFQLIFSFPDTGERIMRLNAREVINKGNSENLILLSIEDITERTMARRKIEESEKRYHMMFMQSPFSFAVMKGKEMVVTLANDSIKKVWGKGNNVEGKPLLRTLPELKNGPVPALLDKVYSTGIPFYGYELLIPIKRKGKLEDVYFNFVYQPYLEADETISGVVVIAYEVTSEVNVQKRIAQSEKQFRLMAELMPQKVWTSDSKGHKNYFNKTLLDFAGRTFEELQGHGWIKIIHPDDRKMNKMKWEESVRTGQMFEMENRLRRKDGKFLWHLTLAVPLKDDNGKIVMWIGTKTEIQEQKEQKEELEKAVFERTAELQHVNEKLIFESIEKEKRANELVIANTKLVFESEEKEKRAAELILVNKELEAFVYVSSHDLQEPLRKIQTFVDRLLEKEDERLSENGKNYFRLMRDAAHRMQTLIDDLLSFSRLNKAERTFESIDLNVIVENVKADLKEAIDDKHATIDTTELCDANVIPFQFNQLMHNLISNALKFSKPDPPPQIIIRSHVAKGSKLNNKDLSPDKNYCHISVTDNGIGFEKEYSKKIFEVFQQLHGKEEYAGTGIGLAIVKKIVDNHDGIITATSKLHSGTTFDIYLPAS